MVWKRYGRKNIRSLIKLCLPVIGIIPWVVIKLKLIFTAEKSGVSVQQAVTDGAGGLSYSGQLFTRFLNGHSIIFIGYIVALIIILIWSEKRVKSITVYPSLGLFVTFANPLLIKYIAGWITGVDVYWRIFWLFNSSLVFVVAAIILIDKCINIKEVVLGTTVSIIFIVSCGTSVLKMEDGKIVLTSSSLIRALYKSLILFMRIRKKIQRYCYCQKTCHMVYVSIVVIFVLL